LRIIGASDPSIAFGCPWKVAVGDLDLIIPFAEGIFDQGPQGQIIPHLGKDYVTDMENLTIVINLNEGVLFHDGSELTGEVVAWNINNAIETKMIDAAVQSAEGSGKYQVTVHLSPWTNCGIGSFTSHNFAIVSKENYDKLGERGAMENPVGTGPFIVDKIENGVKVIYKKNENYWQEGKPYLDAIEMVRIEDVFMQQSAMEDTAPETGCQMVHSFSPFVTSQLAAQDGFYVLKQNIGPFSLIPSSLDPDSPISQLEVRQAISYAINREEIAAACGYGLLSPANQFVPDTWADSLDDSYNLSFDPEKGKELLAAAGYPDGFSMVIHRDMAVDEEIATAIQGQLATIGIKVTIDTPDAGRFIELRNHGWDDMLLTATRILPNTLDSYYLFFDSKYIFMPSASRGDDAAYAEAERIARSTTEMPDPETSKVLNQMIIENLTCIPVVDNWDFAIMRDYVHGSGYADYGASTQWLPENTWMEQS
jgi:ABC-type transport system substrate-binding protein